FFPIDAETCRYLTFTGRDAQRVALVEAYARAQGLWRDESSPEPVFTDTLGLDMGPVEPALAGPKRPQDRVALSSAAAEFEKALKDGFAHPSPASAPVSGLEGPNAKSTLDDGDVVIAAITSCTNTSNPAVLFAAG